MASLFSRIVSGEIPCYKIAETENCLAFLDIFPLTKGHTLVIPKHETDHWLDLPDQLQAELWMFASQVGKAVHQAFPAQRIGVVIAGFEIPHAHIHLIPVNEMQEMDFKNPKLKLSQEEFGEIASKIISSFPGSQQ